MANQAQDRATNSYLVEVKKSNDFTLQELIILLKGNLNVKVSKYYQMIK